ncbi:hypothetical protein [Acinetobacter sp.]|uniref:hypothetical protein n=1 Tax=Acinetobacter sp. TaxID=472 RepID=UPI00388FD9D0
MMTDSNLPRWSARLDAFRPDPQDFHDLAGMVNSHFRVHQSIDQFLGPYNARQRNAGTPYRAPERDMLKQLIKQGGMNDFTYSAMLQSIIRFCETHKGLKALPAPHPSTIHSIQLPQSAFELKQRGQETEIHIIGIETPVIVKGLKDPQMIKFIIVRPKLSKLGTASSKNWEVLFYRSNFGFIPEWVDSSLNPRYSGVIQ